MPDYMIDCGELLACACEQVYWPLDADWYKGRILGYNFDTGRHHVIAFTAVIHTLFILKYVT